MNVHSYDCDNFTKEFYRINFGIEDFTPIQVAQPPPPAVKQVSIAISYTVDSKSGYVDVAIQSLQSQTYRMQTSFYIAGHVL